MNTPSNTPSRDAREEPPIYRLSIHRYFDIASASPWEWFTLETSKMVGIFRKRRVWRPVMVDGYDGFGIIHKGARARGDRDWAERIAKEYGIKVPV